MGIEVCLEQVYKAYQKQVRQVHVLQGVDLKIPAGQSTAITGVSGAGKSTLLHLIGLLDHPDGGRVLLNKEPMANKTPAQLATLRNQMLGFVFQFHHLLEDFSAVENVAMPLLLGGKSKIEAQKIAAIMLEKVGLSQRLHHRPAELSGGEQQRAAIARALVHEPPLLLMDEPTGNLDFQTAEHIHQLILETARTLTTTLIVVTHKLSFAKQFDLHYRLEGGALVA